MRDVIELINHTRQIPGSSSKVSYLKEHRTPMLDLIVADAMDPSITYGVTSKDIIVECAEGDETDYSPFNQLLGRLAFRDLTGHAALDAIAKTLASYPSAYREFLCRILDRDLQLGISWKTYRAEVMGITEKYEVALAQHLEKAKGVNPVDGTWFASRKCDGCVSGDTLVEIEGIGALPISEVVERKLRGKIKSMDPATGEVVYSDIVDWMHNVPDFDSAHKDWFLLELADGRSLKITGNDSVYAKDRGWTRADSLKEGDELLTGTLYTTVSKISRISPRESYELTVATTHCFFCNGILKHNCRCITIVDTISGTVEFRSRQNKEFMTLDNLKPAVLRFCSPLTGKWVLDGELCKVNENGDEDFQAMMKEIRRKDYAIENCCYQIFDILTYSEFCAGTSKEILATRFKRIANLGLEYASSPHEPCYVKPLRQEILHTQADFDRWSDYVSAGNWEGFMLRKNTGYQSGRTKDLLKVKKFSDLEATVKAIECGKMATSLPGQGTVEYEGVTNLIILHKGNEVGVGAGLSREQRIAWMNNPDLIVGKTVTIKYFETTIAQDGKESLRFPTLKHVYENGRDC